MINTIREIQLKSLGGVKEETWAEKEEEGEPGLETLLDSQRGRDQGRSAEVTVCEKSRMEQRRC